MAWVSLNDMFVNKAGGSISGNLSVDGSLTINSGKGDGSTYNVATQLTNLNNNKAAVSHTHSATDITKGTLSLDHLPTIPVSKGGTGATTASAALTNLGAASAQALKDLQDSVSPKRIDVNVTNKHSCLFALHVCRSGSIVAIEGSLNADFSVSAFSTTTLASGLPPNANDGVGGSSFSCQSNWIKGGYVTVTINGNLMLINKAEAINGWTFFSHCYIAND